MSLLDATGRALTPLEMLAVQVRGMQPMVGGGARSLFPQSANLFAQGLSNAAPRAALPSAGNLGFAMGEGAPFNLMRSFPAASAGAEAGLAGTVAAGAAEAAPGLLARLGALPAGLAAAGPGAVVSRAGLGGLAGSIGSGLIDKVVPGSNSLGEQSLQGAALGAGVGAGVGSVVPVLGTGLGALVGGGVGAIGGALTSLFGKKPKAPESLDSIMARVIDAGAISPDAATAIANKYAGMVALDASKKGKELARQAALQLLQAEVMNPSASPTSLTPAQWTPEQILATQVQAAKYLAPFAEQTVSNAGHARDLTNSLSQGLNPAAAKFLQIGAEQEYAASTKLANAYATQALLSPQMAALQQQMQYRDQIASQIAQQSIAQMLSGGQTGGQDLGALLSQLGAQ